MRSFFSKRIGIIILTIIILAATLVALSSCIQSGDSDDGQEPDDEQETNDGQDQSEPEYTPTEGLSYILNEDESGYTVSGIGTATDTDIVIPSEHNGLPVTNIGDSTFNSCFSLTSIFIPDSVTSIGDFAFTYCELLTNIIVDENNTAYASIDGNLYNKDKTTLIQYAIGKTATEFTIPDSVTSIEMGAFVASASLKNITVDENNTAYASIDGNLYNKDKTTLIQYAIGKTATEFTIPDGVTSIGYGAFAACTSLTSITVDENNTAYASIDGNLYNKDKTTLIQYAIGKTATEFTIPDSVTSIGVQAFSECTSLTSIDIPDSVTVIGNSAFYNCTSLTDVYYGGTEEQWNGISIDRYNENLTSANIHFSAAEGTQAA